MEAIMKIETPLHTEHQLDQLAGQFEHWRQTRAHPCECIPQPLWEQAVALTTVLPYTRVAKHLRLAPTDLKKHMAAEPEQGAAVPPTPPGFVEVPPMAASLQLSSPTEVELLRPDGARLRLHAPETSLCAIVRSFLEA
jgi:hypothetical protein